MKVGKRAGAALKAASTLAVSPALTLAELSRAAQVPAPFLQQTMLFLKRSGLVFSRPGRRGGYRLARPAGSISVGDVLRAVQGPPAPMPCALPGGAKGCAEAAACRLRPVWVRVRQATEAVVDRISLAELAGPEVSA